MWWIQFQLGVKIISNHSNSMITTLPRIIIITITIIITVYFGATWLGTKHSDR